jgi:hypothetical protein
MSFRRVTGHHIVVGCPCEGSNSEAYVIEYEFLVACEGRGINGISLLKREERVR